MYLGMVYAMLCIGILGFTQSNIHKSYFFFMLKIFKNSSLVISYQEYKYLDSRTNKEYIRYSFWTWALPIITEFYNLFYLNKVKIVPQDLSLLTPLALAHWIMQDGSFSSSWGIYLCTDAFLPNDTNRLANFLSTKYNFKCTTPKAPGKTGALRIYISATSLELLRTLVQPYMEASMIYKLGL